jgi:short-subunit dehydrogenase
MDILRHKTAFVTGATSGIGASYARRFASEGYDLILTGRRIDKLNALADRLREEYAVCVETLCIELSDKEEIERFEQTVCGGEIDVLVNNAGFGCNALFSEGPAETWEAMVNAHVLAPMRLARAVLPGMLARKKGAIINVSSDGAFLLIPKNAVYASTKAFLKIFTESLHLELAGTGVRVQAVCPGLTKTDFHEKMGIEKGRQRDRGPIHWMEPDEVVALSMEALRKGKVVYIPGFRNRLMIGLLGLLPRSLYYRVMAGASKQLFA